VSLQNLKVLSLNGNQVVEIPSKSFASLRSLEELWLNNNKLTTIHSDSFGVHNKLTTVWLENNKINAIDERFIDNTALSTLNMTNNICSQQLTKTRSEIKPNLKNVSTIIDHVVNLNHKSLTLLLHFATNFQHQTRIFVENHPQDKGT